MLRHKAIALVGGLSLLSGCAMLRGPDHSAGTEPATAVRNAGAHSEAEYRAGRDFQGQMRYDRAATAYRNVLAEYPDHAEAHNALGVVYSVQGLTRQAEQEFTAAIAAAPWLSHLHNNLGYLYLQLGRTQDAIVELEQARMLDPANLHALNNLALAEQNAGRRDAAGAEPKQKSAAAAEAARPGVTTPTLQMVMVAPNVWELQPRQTAQPSMGGLAARMGSDLRGPEYVRPRLTNQLPYIQARTEIRHVAGSEVAARARKPAEKHVVLVLRMATELTAKRIPADFRRPMPVSPGRPEFL
jgi:Flp pilus assembly protein TadD